MQNHKNISVQTVHFLSSTKGEVVHEKFNFDQKTNTADHIIGIYRCKDDPGKFILAYEQQVERGSNKVGSILLNGWLKNFGLSRDEVPVYNLQPDCCDDHFIGPFDREGVLQFLEFVYKKSQIDFQTTELSKLRQNFLQSAKLDSSLGYKKKDVIQVQEDNVIHVDFSSRQPAAPK